MEEIETIHDYVTDEVESLIVVNESVETEGLLSNPSNSKPANVNEDSTSGSSNSLPESPWPKLNKFFSVHSTRNQNLSFECLLCRPRKSIISTYITSVCMYVKLYFNTLSSSTIYISWFPRRACYVH